MFPTFREQMEPVIQLVRDQFERGLRLPDEDRRARRRHRRRRGEILAGLEGEALEEMRAAQRDQPPDGAAHARTTTSTSTRAPTRTSGSCSSRSARSSWSRASSTRPTTSCSCATTSCGRSSATRRAIDGRAIVAAARAARERAYTFQPRDWVGTVTETQLAFPYLVNWGFPDKFHRGQAADAGADHRASRARRASSRASRASSVRGRVRRGPRRATSSCAR